MGDDTNDKLKDFLRKVNSSSPSSAAFKGQGRVLGASSEPPKNDPYKNVEPEPNSSSNPSPNPNSSVSGSNLDKSRPDHDRSSEDGVNKLDSLVTSSKRSQNGHSIEICECPACGKAYRTAEEVIDHIESCSGRNEVVETTDLDEVRKNLESRNELGSCVGFFVSGEPPEGWVRLKMVSGSSLSSGFKGKGRVLGTASSSSEPPKNNPYKNVEPPENPSSSSSSNPNPKSSVSGSNLDKSRPDHDRSSEDGFNRFDSLVTSSKRSQNGHSIEICECPACVKAYRTAEEVTDHIESFLRQKEVVETADLDEVEKNLESRNELASCVGAFEGSVRLKKVTSSSSFSAFKGQGRVLGTTSSSSEPPKKNPYKNVEPPKKPSLNPNRYSKSTISSKPSSDHDRSSTDGFNKFDSLITSSKRSQNGHSIQIYECPVCGKAYRTVKEVTEHIESCLGQNEVVETADLDEVRKNLESRNELASCVGVFVSGEPPGGSVEVVMRLLRNVVSNPENDKFRRIRMGNPKIKEAIGSVTGGVELLECVGFKLQEEGEEMWAVMEVPTGEQINSIKEVILMLEPNKVEAVPPTVPKAEDVIAEEPKKVDRQVRVFIPAPNTEAANIELPDSFYKLSMEEIKAEADIRKKKLAESQLLVPRSFKEKQAKAARKKYNATTIRIQFPDEVILQGVFEPRERTTALYEFVRSSLKEPRLEFELRHHPPFLKRRPGIPCFSGPGKTAPTLDEEDLVPAALVRFFPLETDSTCFTGLSDECLEMITQLTSDDTAVSST